MQSIKIDKARKQIRLRDKNGKLSKPINAVELDYFVQQNTFDKHQSQYLNYKGLTYIISNPKNEQDEDIDVEIKSKMETDEELNNRYFMGLDEESKLEILKIQEEYAL